MPTKKNKQQHPKKLFVLDTNVLLYDHTAIYSFQEHDIAIPIVVLEELDNFKKGSELINFEAREFVRELDKIAGDQLFTKGISLGEGLGRLSVEIGEPRSQVPSYFMDNKADHKIIALADDLRNKRKDRQVIIISKDINLRMKAKSIGIPAEDYETGKIRNIDELEECIRVYENIDKSVITKFYSEPYFIPASELEIRENPVPNEYYIFKNHSSSVLTHYNKTQGTFERVYKNSAYGIEPRNAEQTFAMDALMRPEIQLLAITGKAGTGKTLLALAAAIQQKRFFSQIFLARPVVPLANKDIGYLPGDIKSKLDPYMQPLWDNLEVIKNKYSPESSEYKKIQDMVLQEKIYISPLAYIRGRSLDNIFFIVDEAQNLTPHEVKTIITRAGEGTKMVFTGDVYQIDSPYLDSQSNGLAYLVDRMKGQEIFGHVNLIKGERSKLADLASNLL
jgi:PhoH-like ATPase